MVNVGGRSRGCSPCRRRRVKCDETRPVCSRCERGGLECTGPKEMAFVEGTIVKSRRTKKKVPVSTINTGSASLQLPPSVSLIRNRFETYICFTRKFLRRGGAIDLALQDVQLGNLITTGTTAESGQLFNQAFLSFATILFASKHRQTQITDQGYAVHGMALRQLNQALSDPTSRARDEVLLSVATLALSECYVPTGPKVYIKHMIALERLLELRDPRLHCSPRSTELYKSVRHMLIFASLRTGKPSILARAEWKAILRAHCSEEELQEQDLFEILAECSVLLSARDQMLRNWDLNLASSVRQGDEIKQKALDLLSQLRAWKACWDADEKNFYSETLTATSDLTARQATTENDLAPLLTSFEFSSPCSATMFMFYNTTLIYLLRVLASLPRTPETLSLCSQTTTRDVGELDLEADKYLTSERSAALEVCRCIPFDLLQKSRVEFCISPIGHWAITTAWMTLRGTGSMERLWMLDLMNRDSREAIAKGVWE